jgi:hypothetical protein
MTHLWLERRLLGAACRLLRRVNYGFGYGGVGFAGGVWCGGVFSYNSTVNNFGSVNITNTYSKTVINTNVTSNVSFRHWRHDGNGDTGGAGCS